MATRTREFRVLNRHVFDLSKVGVINTLKKKESKRRERKIMFCRRYRQQPEWNKID